MLNRMNSFLRSLWRLADYVTPDVFRLPFVHARLLKKLDEWETHKEFEDIRNLSEPLLKEYLGTEWTRAKELDEKLNKLTAALSVAVTVGGVQSKALFDGLAASPAKTAVTILLFLSMSFFLLGALIGFSGLRPKPRFGYGATYLAIIEKGGAEATKTMIEAACSFQIMNLVRANEASTAIVSVRNGVIAFFLAITVSFFAPAVAKNSAILAASQSPHTTPLLAGGGVQFPAPTAYIAAYPSVITAGQNAVLVWASSNATTCDAKGSWQGTRATGGSVIVSPVAGDFPYMLNCAGPGGNISSSATLVVVSAPPPSLSHGRQHRKGNH